MLISQSSRRWMVRLLVIGVLLLLLLTPCLFIIASWNTGKLTPDNAFAFMKDLSIRRASDSEVVACLGESDKVRGQQLISNFSNVDYVRKWEFHQETFDRYNELKITGFFDQQGNSITFINAMDQLEGKRLWLFRWQRLLKFTGL